jgi:hypothetical protein
MTVHLLLVKVKQVGPVHAMHVAEHCALNYISPRVLAFQ